MKIKRLNRCHSPLKLGALEERETGISHQRGERLGLWMIVTG